VTLCPTNCAAGNGGETAAVRLPTHRPRAPRAQRQSSREGEGEGPKPQTAPEEHEILQGPLLYIVGAVDFRPFVTAFSMTMHKN
jgi:hypothetical protein